MSLSIIYAVTNAVRYSRDASIEEIKQTRLELQTRLNKALAELKSKSADLAELRGIVSGLSDWTDAISDQQSELIPLAKKLRELVESFGQDWDKTRLNAHSINELRLAEATVALVLGKPEEVRRILGDTETQLLEELQLRASSFLVEDNWPEAVKRFQAVLALDKLNLVALEGLGVSSYHLSDFPTALFAQNQLINQLRHGENQNTNRLGIAIMNRGKTQLQIRDVDKAVEDFDEALTIFTDLDGEKVTFNLMEALLNRANATIFKMDREKSMQEIQHAINLVDKLPCSPEQRKLRPTLFLSLARANMLKPANLEGALSCIEESIKLLESVPENEKNLVNRRTLFVAYFRKATLLSSISSEKDTVLDSFNKAEELAKGLPGKELQGSLRLARGNYYWGAQDMGRAFADFKFAVAELKNIVEFGQRPDLVDEYALALSNISYLKSQMALASKDTSSNKDLLEQAKMDATLAIEILGQVEVSFNRDRDRLLSIAIKHRGLAHFLLGEYKQALGDYTNSNRIVARLLKLGQDELKQSLRDGYWNLALTHRALQDSKMAVEAFSEAIKIQNELVGVGIGSLEQLATYHSYRMLDNYNTKAYVEAIADAEVAMSIHMELFKSSRTDAAKAKLAAAANHLATILVQCPDLSLRDCRRAVALAINACELTSYKEYAYLMTLAEAISEWFDQFKRKTEKWIRTRCPSRSATIFITTIAFSKPLVVRRFYDLLQ